jgi:predicted MPP superfamily phosphohydrolase
MFAGTAVGVLGHGYAYEREALRAISADLPVAGLAPEHDGVRVGLITDLHHSQFTTQSDVARAVDLVMAHSPDIVILGGDYVSLQNRRYMEPCAEALSPLTAPQGVVAVLGNHDDDRVMPGALARRGFTVLRDQRTVITVNRAPLELAGIRFWTRKTVEIARVVSSSAYTTILLAHDPRMLTEAIALAIPAVLSGHTHGGQVVLPLLGTPGLRDFPVLAGMASRSGTSIFVSRGVGTVYVPVRVNCPPDVAILTLRRQSRSVDKR